MIYKPELAERALHALRDELTRDHGPVDFHLTCCQHPTGLEAGTRIVNTCAGCDRRFRESEENISTVSLWEVLARSTTFPFPDYGGAEITVHDACPTRGESRVHEAIRTLLARMNLTVTEPRDTREGAVCCGDSLYGKAPAEAVKAAMIRRAEAMPKENVAVYCVSCVKSMHVGGKSPRYLVDLLFGEPTEIGTYESDAWHGELERFIETH